MSTKATLAPTGANDTTAAARVLYEVQVGYKDDSGKDRWLGHWRGVAGSEASACGTARDHVWESRLDAEGRSPVYATRVMPRYVIAEGWGHIFSGTSETMTRWAYDRVEEKLAAAEFKGGPGGSKWVAMNGADRADLTESIQDNDADSNPGDFGLAESDDVPQWAVPAPRPRNPRP